MKIMHKIEVEVMELDDVLLVSTEDELEYKLVVRNPFPEEADCKNKILSISVETETDAEEELGDFIISAITTGKPIFGIGIHETDDDNMPRRASALKTKPVTKIEYYDSNIP